MLGFSFARLMGIVVVLSATLWLVIQLGDQDWPEAGLALCLLVAGLALAVWGDRRLERTKEQREAQRQREGQAYQGFDLDVGLRWSKWGLLTLILCALLTVMLRWMLPDLWQSGLYGKAILFGGVSLFFAVVFLGMLSLGLRALRGQILLNVGPPGVQISSLPLLPWSQLHGIDLQEIIVQSGKQWQLILATDDAYLQSLPSRWWVACFLWPVVRWPRKKSVIGVSLAFLDDNPHTVVQAVRHIGARYGAPLVEGWRHFQPIAEAREARRLQLEADESMREVERSLDELRRMGSATNLDPARIAAMNSRVTAGLERMQSTSHANLAHLKTRGDKRLLQFRSAMRGVWIVFGVVMVWVVARIVLALAR